MTSKIGFVLLTHNAPAQVVRLARRLTDLFDRPPIVCHHDFSQCGLPLESFGDNVTFVRPHLRTQWAEFPVVTAIVRSLDLLFGKFAGPEWFVLLSGADYPIKPAQRVLDDLRAGSYDAHIRHEWINPEKFEREWQQLCYQRYFTKRIRVPHLTRKLRFEWRHRHLPHALVSPLLPFSDSLRCYAGSLWFSANRRAGRYLIDHAANHPALARHGSHVQYSDEFYFQTVLANAAGLRLRNDNDRFVEFLDGKPNPRTLGLEDVDRMLASPAHFARKFAPDRPEVLDAVDAAVDRC